MKKIVIAGAGQGGLTAAANLAKNGFDVTIIEAKQRDEMGHDWCDYLDMDAFDYSGIARPSEDMFDYGRQQGYVNPSATMKIKTDLNPKSIIMDRKVLSAYLIECAENAGAKIIFGQKVLGAVTEGSCVKGLRILGEDGEYTIEADLVVDAAGMYSPVRQSLPESCGIQKVIEKGDVFHVYRVYYKNSSGTITDPPYIVTLFHMNKPGIDWTLTEEDYVDILVGKFGSEGELTMKEVEEAVADYRRQFPFISDEVVRGGSFADIPLTKMIPMLVCDGYAAVGDSAGMTVPLNGCGIVLSMRAGKILANTVMKAYGPYTKKALWPYQYEYFQTLGHELVTVDIIKNFFTYIKGSDVDYVLEKKVLSAKQLSFGDGQGLNITPEFVMRALSVAVPMRKVIPPLVMQMKGMPLKFISAKLMPKEYDEKKVSAWIKMYDVI